MSKKECRCDYVIPVACPCGYTGPCRCGACHGGACDVAKPAAAEAWVVLRERGDLDEYDTTYQFSVVAVARSPDEAETEAARLGAENASLQARWRARVRELCDREWNSLSERSSWSDVVNVLALRFKRDTGVPTWRDNAEWRAYSELDKHLLPDGEVPDEEFRFRVVGPVPMVGG